MATPILNITELANGQVDQYITANEMGRSLEAAGNDFLSVDLSAGNVALTAAQYRGYVLFRSSGNAVARNLTLQAIKRLIVVHNNGTDILSVIVGSTTVAIPVAEAQLLYSDGTTNGLISIAGGAGGGGGAAVSIIAPDTATTHTAVVANNGGLLIFNSASDCTITVPQTSTEALDAGFHLLVRNDGGGNVLVGLEGTDTLDGVSLWADPTQEVTIIKEVEGSPNAWGLIGNNWLPSAVEDDALTAPPATPVVGAVYIPLATATGTWATHETEFAIHVGSDVYEFVAPSTGVTVYEKTSAAWVSFNGTAWAEQAGGGATAARKNALFNGGFNVQQRGVTFDSTTSPLNSDDTYLLDRWILLSDGNDVVDVTSQSGGGVSGNADYIRLDVETVSKKFGIFQVIENGNLRGIIGDTVSLSFDVRVSDATKLSDIRAVVVAWDGTADTVTSDVVSTWNAEGARPTLVANWTAENVDADLAVTSTWTRISIDGVSVDTASAANVGVFIYQNNVATNNTLGTLLEITEAQLEKGSVATGFEHRSIGEELQLCQRYYEEGNAYRSGAIVNTTAGAESTSYTVIKRAVPTLGITGSAFINFTGVAAITSTLVDSFGHYPTGGTSGAQGRYLVAWTADSEL